MSGSPSGTDGDVATSRNFPPGNAHLLVPARPRRAALAGLSLYDAVSPRQRRILRVGRAAARLGLIRLLPRAVEVADVPTRGWWSEWVAGVVEPAVGAVGFRPRRTSEGRVRCLLLAEDGSPRAFAKIVAARGSGVLEREATVHAVLDQESPLRFRVPRMLRRGRLGDWTYLLFEAIPDVSHRPLPGDPRLVAEIVDELQTSFAGLPRPADVPADHVPGHGDFTRRNARVTADGEVWVIDWEYAGWMPRLADELRFWAHHVGHGWRWPARRHAERVVRILRARGSDDEILEAVAWPEFNTPAEQAVRDATAALVTGPDA